MMPRSMATPTSAGDDEGERQGDGQRPVEQPRRVDADDLLHDEGGVGAEHHHLAMGHVDDPHDAEGDGQTDGRQQQDRAQRQAVPEVLQDIPQRQRALDDADRLVGRGEHRRGRRRRQAGEQRQRVLVAAVADDGDGGELVRFARPAHGEDDGGARLFLHALDVRVLLGGDRLFERRQGGGVAVAEHGFRRGHALGRIGGHQLQLAERGGDGVADPVVDPHLLDIGGLAGNRRAGGGVDIARAGLDVGLAVGREIEGAVLERLDDVERPFVAAGGDGIDGFGGGRIAVSGELGQRIVEGTGMGADRRQEQHDDREKKRQQAAEHEHRVFPGPGSG